MSKSKFNLSLKKNYLTAIKHAVGAELFQSVFVSIDGKTVDITERGRLSCGIFVSWILFHYELIQENHTTVQGVIQDLEASGWAKIARPRVGAVLVWEASMEHGEEPHRHIGFYIGNQRAVSNSSKHRVPREHHWTFGKNKRKAKRKVESMYWHRSLL